MCRKLMLAICSIALIMLNALFCNGQTLGMQWQKLFGSQFIEKGTTVIQTKDGGFLFGGSVYRSNRPDFHGEYDVWLIKTDASGNVQWDKLYGGSWTEDVSSIVETQDGGFVVVGSTNSKDGDVSGVHDTSHASKDLWVFKVNTAGNIVWQKAIGGTGNESAASIVTTADNKLLVLGTSNSTDGDVSGLHLYHSAVEQPDILLVNLDANGNILWHKCYGGTSSEFGFEIHPMNDGSYFISGTAYSSDGDVQGHHGASDFFLLKIDATGSIMKSSCIGGTEYEGNGSFAQQPGDFGFMLLVYSDSHDGDFAGGASSLQYTLLRLDSAFDIEWTKTYGGSSLEIPTRIISLPHGGYVLGGRTSSVNGDLDTSLITSDGNNRIWLLQVDEAGRKVRSTTIGGSAQDDFSMMAPTKDGGYVFIGTTKSPDGTLSDQTIFGLGDVWVVKMMDATLSVAGPHASSIEPLVYPTSTIGPVHIRFEQSVSAQISVQNAYGALISQSKLSGASAAIDLSNEPAGIYFLTISTHAGSKSVKVLKY